MKLLILTQKVDINDDVLGFFHGWIVEFSKHVDKLTVICLEEGRHNLPKNVQVFSLGKERNKSKLHYLFNLFKYTWRLRHDYKYVFVHMNQEYVLLLGWFWRLFGKKIFMWRNHYSGSIFTGLAVFFCNKIFCTSKFSYTAKYRKNIIMPVGINTDTFTRISKHATPKSILSLGRISPSKNLSFLIKGLETLSNKGVNFNLSIYGGTLPKDSSYKEMLKDYVTNGNMSDKVSFHQGIPNNQTPKVYNNYEIFVNLSPDGMYDKTILEAMACERLVLVSNKNLVGEIRDNFLFKKDNLEDFVSKLESLLAIDDQRKLELGKELREYVVSNHSLKNLSNKLFGLLKKIDE